MSLIPWLIIWMIFRPFIAALSGAVGWSWPAIRHREPEVPRDHLDRAVRDVIHACRANGAGVASEMMICGDEDVPPVRLRHVVGVSVPGYVAYVAYRAAWWRGVRLLVLPQRLVLTWHLRTIVVDGRGTLCVRGISYVLPPRHDPEYGRPERYVDGLHDRAWEPLLAHQSSLDVEDAAATEVLRAMLDRERPAVVSPVMPSQGPAVVDPEGES